jgi:hypothetical protein
MPVTLDLSPATMERLKSKAAERGRTVEAYLQELAERDAIGENGSVGREGAFAASMSAEEWSSAWRAWAAGHRGLPGIADDSRESIYEGRGQ